MGLFICRNDTSCWNSLVYGLSRTLDIQEITSQHDKRTKDNLFIFIKDDLEQRLHFIDESLQYRDYKPFFTDMWDAIILSGNHSLLSFELFKNIQRTYSWMKYYNSEIESRDNEKSKEKTLLELLDDVAKSIHKTMQKLDEERKSS